MRYLDAGFLSALQAERLTLAYCWKITRTDGVVMGFTSHDRPLGIEGLTYSANTGFLPSAAESSTRLETGNLTLKSFLDSEAISEPDLIAGVYDGAGVKIFLVDYLDLPSDLTSHPYKFLWLAEGTIGRVTNTDRTFSVELRSLTQRLNQKKAVLTSPLCRYSLGDSQCTVNLSSFTTELTAGFVTDNQVINLADAIPNGLYTFGVVEFTSGAANGRRFGVALSDSYSITLFEPCPWVIEQGDTFNAIAGCAKTREACKSFSNIVNFGGEPDLPGVDEYLAGYVG